MILSLVASFSQSMSPFELLPNPFSPNSIFVKSNIFVFDPHFSNGNFIFDFLAGTLRGADPSNHQRIECLYLLPRGYGGSISYHKSKSIGVRSPNGRHFFEHLLYEDNILYENKILLENVILCEDKKSSMKRIDSPSKHP